MADKKPNNSGVNDAPITEKLFIDKSSALKIAPTLASGKPKSGGSYA